MGLYRARSWKRRIHQQLTQDLKFLTWHGNTFDKDEWRFSFFCDEEVQFLSVTHWMLLVCWVNPLKHERNTHQGRFCLVMERLYVCLFLTHLMSQGTCARCQRFRVRHHLPWPVASASHPLVKTTWGLIAHERQVKKEGNISLRCMACRIP